MDNKEKLELEMKKLSQGVQQIDVQLSNALGNLQRAEESVKAKENELVALSNRFSQTQNIYNLLYPKEEEATEESE